MNIKRKAIEPIVATILLVVVAVILVTIVLAWGRNFATSGTNQANDVISSACSGATIAISDCDWNSTSEIAVFTIKNTSDTYTFAENDFVINVYDASELTDADTENTSSTIALGPGLTVIEDVNASGITSASSVKVTVRSNTCPNMATSEIATCN
jgi:hypothetical protein